MLGYARGYKKIEDKAPKVEASAEYGYKRAVRMGRYNNLVLVVLILSVVLVVVVLIYALYSFLHGSRMVNIAGVHFSQNVKEAARQLVETGKITGNQTEPGYEGWMTFGNQIFELKYPPEWEAVERDNQMVIKKFNRKTYGYFDSLAVDIKITNLDNPDNIALVDYLDKNNLEIGVKKEEILGGKKALRTGVFKDPQGLVRRDIYWPMEGKILYLEAIFYNNNYAENFGDFEKIVQSIRFIN